MFVAGEMTIVVTIVCYIDKVLGAETGGAVKDFYRDLGSRIRRLRQDRLTQQMLADRVGLSRAAIANIELGRQGVPSHMLARFASALGVPASELLPDLRSSSDQHHAVRRARLMPRDRETVMRVLSRVREDRPSDA